MEAHPELLHALLEFGRAPRKRKEDVIADYLEVCRAQHAQPHVWNANVEIVEALSRYPSLFGAIEGEEVREVLSSIEAIAEELLEAQPALVDFSGFESDAGRRMCLLCDRALEAIDSSAVREISFFVLMNHVTD